jgi:uncharacterized repeat protein (TIGR02543 family)
MMINRIKQIALAVSAGFIFLTCTNPFFPGIVDKTPKTENPSPVNRTPGPITYIVTFHIGPGMVFADNTSKQEDTIVEYHLSEGAKIPKLPALIHPGYAFGGWYTDDVTWSELWDFDTVITSNMDLYARWVPEPPAGIKIIFETYSGNPKPGVQNLDRGALVVEPPPVTRDGYAFDGWYTETAFTRKWNFAADTVTTDMTLYAKWHQVVYTVKFETNGGSPSPSAQKIASGARAVMPPAVYNYPSGFVDWYKDAACTSGNEWNFTTNKVTDNITLYAKWDIPNFNVSFNTYDNNGTPVEFTELVPPNAKLVFQEEYIKIDYPGHSFGGWYRESTFNTPWDFANDTVTGNISLWARWDIPAFIVSFESNGGSPVPADQHITSGSKAVIPSPMTRTDGYGFAGWFKEAACINEWNFNTLVTGDIILYAKWVAPPKYYTVTFDTSGIITAPVPQTIIEGGKITEPLGSSTNRPGYSFRGWFTDDSTLWNFAADTVNKDITLHADWSIIYYTVIFNVTDSYPVDQNFIYGGGDQKPEIQIITYGEKIIEPLDMTRDSMAIVNGYGFDGWWLLDTSTQAEWKFEDYTVGPAYTTTGTTNINLYPKWIKDQKYLDYADSYPRVDNGNLVWVRKGYFSMGSSKSVSSGYPVPRPVHQVTLTQGFFAGMYLITQQQYVKVMGYNPSSITTNSGNNPVNRVTWLDAIVFCNKLTDMENAAKNLNLVKVYNIDESSIVYADGSKWPVSSNQTIISAKVTINWGANGYRLPTEAEWEYTARSGKCSPGDFDWSGSNTASEVAWYGGTGGTATDHTTHPVGLLKPNILRTFDMSGNLCEWCWDEFGSGYYTTSSPSITDPKGPGPDTVIINNPGKDTYRVRRGGSWNHVENNTRTFLRDSFQPTDTNMTNFWTIGFRVVRGPLQ